MVATVALLMAACGGGGEPYAGSLSAPGELRGRTIGVAALDGAATLQTRYVLQEAYGLDVGLEVGDVAIDESPADSLPALLAEGEIDAAVLPPFSAFQLLRDDEFHVLSHVTEEMRELTGAPIVSSVLVTYPDVAEQKAGALQELDRLLAASVAYFEANEDGVLEALAADLDADQEFLRWQSKRQRLHFGDLSLDVQEGVLDIWRVAVTLGDIETYPDLSAVLFGLGDTRSSATTMDGGRTTISLALLDDPSRHAALYAVEQGIVTSDSIDLDVSYLPASVLAEAAPARQYHVIEAAPLAVATGSVQGLDLVLLSGGVLDFDGTLLFVRSGPVRG